MKSRLKTQLCRGLQRTPGQSSTNSTNGEEKCKRLNAKYSELLSSHPNIATVCIWGVLNQWFTTGEGTCFHQSRLWASWRDAFLRALTFICHLRHRILSEEQLLQKCEFWKSIWAYKHQLQYHNAKMNPFVQMTDSSVLFSASSSAELSHASAEQGWSYKLYLSQINNAVSLGEVPSHHHMPWPSLLLQPLQPTKLAENYSLYFLDYLSAGLASWLTQPRVWWAAEVVQEKRLCKGGPSHFGIRKQIGSLLNVQLHH